MRRRRWLMVLRVVIICHNDTFVRWTVDCGLWTLIVWVGAQLCQRVAFRASEEQQGKIEQCVTKEEHSEG